MPHPAEDQRFLELLQMVELGRKCEGKSSHNIGSGHVAQAAEVTAAREAHPAHGNESGVFFFLCPECEAIRQRQIALRELLHAQGIDFPVEVLGP